VTVIRIIVDCSACAWCLPVRPGFGDQGEATRWYDENVGPHVTATGHEVAAMIVTRHDDRPIERTRLVFGPREGGPASDPARPDQ
jgi:hypothetical protein